MKKFLLCFLAIFFTMNLQAQILSEDFESGTFPPDGWMLQSSNEAFTWYLYEVGPITGTYSATVEYDPALVFQDEILISPAMDLSSNSSATLTFNASLSYYWAVDPNDNYDFNVLVSTDGGTTWTEIWDETELGTFGNFVPIPVEISLNDYVGQSGVHIGFQYLGVDGAQVILDDIVVLDCVPPSFSSFTAASESSITFEFDANLGDSGFVSTVYGMAGFDPATEGTTLSDISSPYTIEGLSPVTEYEIYLQSDCSGDGNLSEWIGPFSFTTVGTLLVNEMCDESAMSVNYNTTFAPAVPSTSCIENDNTVGYIFSFVAPDSGNIALNNTTLSGSDTVAATIYDADGNEVYCEILAEGYNEVIGLLPGAEYTVSLYNLGIENSNHNICINAVNCPLPGDAGISSVGINSAIITISAVGEENQWDLEVVPSGTEPSGTPTHENVSSPYTIDGLMDGTDYDVYWRVDCSEDSSNTSSWVGPVSFRTTQSVACNENAVNTTYCYDNFDQKLFGFESTDGSTLRVDFNAGTVEADYDAVVVLDSDGITTLYNGDNGGEDMGGLSFVASGDKIYIGVFADSSVSCANGGEFTPLDFDVTCSACTPPAFDTEIVTDCENNEFSITVNVTSLGTGDMLTLSDNMGSDSQEVSSTGTYQFGPYTSGSAVVFTLVDEDEPTCATTESESYLCPVSNDECVNATPLSVEYGVSAATQFTNASLEGATDSGIAASECDGWTGTANDDVWFSFEAGVANINITMPETWDAVVELFGGECGALEHITCADFSGTPTITINAVDLTPGETYYFRVYAYSSTTPADTAFSVAVWSEETLAINEIDVNSNKLVAYPNPVQDVLNIKGMDAAKVNVYDIKGNLIEVTLRDNTIAVDQLAVGVYILQVEDREGNLQTVKFIKK